MSKKHKGGPAPIPPGNQPKKFGPQKPEQDVAPEPQRGDPPSDQDPKRRLGDYEGAGEHSIQQPGGKQGPNR